MRIYYSCCLCKYLPSTGYGPQSPPLPLSPAPALAVTPDALPAHRHLAPHATALAPRPKDQRPTLSAACAWLCLHNSLCLHISLCWHISSQPPAVSRSESLAEPAPTCLSQPALAYISACAAETASASPRAVYQTRYPTPNHLADVA